MIIERGDAGALADSRCKRLNMLHDNAAHIEGRTTCIEGQR